MRHDGPIHPTRPQGGSRNPCPLEPRVLASRRSGATPPLAERQALDAHLAECASCRSAVRLSTALAHLAAEGPGFELPDPSRLYWRARVLERLVGDGEATERAVRPVRWVWWLSGVLVALGGAVGVSEWLGAVVSGVMGGAVEGLGRVGEAMAGPLAGATGLEPGVVQVGVWLGLGLLAGASLLAAHSVLEEGLG